MSNKQCTAEKVETASVQAPVALSVIGTTSAVTSGITLQPDSSADATSHQASVADTSEREPCSKNEEKHKSKDGMNSKGYQRTPKTCCLCWCCCCSCSCLSHVPRQQQTLSKDRNDAAAIPSKEEINSWGESFDNLIRNPVGRQLFHDFLKYEYSEENLLFWLACEELKEETDPDIVEEKARIIYEDFISILSPKEVSLDSRVREKVNKNMVQPSLTTFDEAQMQIYTLMHRDSYPRFLNSTLYRNLVETNSIQEDNVT